jgi:peptide chain release factor 3
VLQFEVLKERLLNEYRVKCILERLSYQYARWVGGSEEALEWLQARRDYPVLRDRNDQPVLLSDSLWSMNFALQNATGLELYDVEPL